MSRIRYQKLKKKKMLYTRNNSCIVVAVINMEKLHKQTVSVFWGDSITIHTITTHGIKHHLKLSDDKPIFVRIYRQAPKQKEEIKKQISKPLKNHLLYRKVILLGHVPIHSTKEDHDHHASGEQKYRLAIDYRKLNDTTIEG